MAVFPGDAEVTSSTNVFGWSGSKTPALRLRSLEAATSVDFNLWRRSGFETRRARSSSSHSKRTGTKTASQASAAPAIC